MPDGSPALAAADALVGMCGSAAEVPPMILIAGVTGSGKSTLLDFLRSSSQVVSAKKFTTRRPRSGEGAEEFNFVAEIPPEAAAFRYESVGASYALDPQSVANASENKKVLAMTCSSPQLAAQFRSVASVTFVYVYRPRRPGDLSALLDQRGTSGHLRQLREEEVRTEMVEYARTISVYDLVVLNCGTVDELRAQSAAVLQVAWGGGWTG